MTSYAVSINPDLDNEKKTWDKPENLRVLTTCIHLYQTGLTGMNLFHNIL